MAGENPCDCRYPGDDVIEHYGREAMISLVALYKFLRDHEQTLGLCNGWTLEWHCHGGGIKVLELCEKRHWVYIVRPCLNNYQQALWKFEQELKKYPQLYDEYVKYVYIKGKPKD